MISIVKIQAGTGSMQYGNELRLYKNFFQPVMKLTKKERVDGRLKRVYDIAKTPYQRLTESGQLSKEQEKSLKKLYRGLNPVKLKYIVDAKLEKLYNTYHKKKKGRKNSRSGYFLVIWTKGQLGEIWAGLLKN